MEEVDKDKSENNKDKTVCLHMRVYVKDYMRFIVLCKLQGCDHSTAFKTAVDLLERGGIQLRTYPIEESKKSKLGNYKFKMVQLDIRVFTEDYKRFVAWCELYNCLRPKAFKMAVGRLMDEEILTPRVSKSPRLILKNWCQKGWALMKAFLSKHH